MRHAVGEFFHLRNGLLQGDRTFSYQSLQLGSKPQLRFPISFQPLLFLGNISCDFRRANNLPTAVLDRRHRQRNIDSATTLSHAHRLIMLDALAFLESFYYSGFFVL